MVFVCRLVIHPVRGWVVDRVVGGAELLAVAGMGLLQMGYGWELGDGVLTVAAGVELVGWKFAVDLEWFGHVFLLDFGH